MPDAIGFQAIRPVMSLVDHLPAAAGLPANLISLNIEVETYLCMPRSGPRRPWAGFCGPESLDLLRQATGALTDSLRLPPGMLG